MLYLLTYLFIFRCKLFEDDSRGDVILETSARQDEKCETYKGSKVCLKKFHETSGDATKACYVEIEKMKEAHDGKF